jgi:putative copper export protein
MMLLVALTIPPAAKALAVIGAVYGLIQGAKKIPAVTPYLTGWVAVAVNVILTACGLLLTIPPDQLYTTNTALLLLTTILGAAGVHGTVASFTPPQILASVPPSTQVKEVPATLVPDDPKAVPAEPSK